MDSNLPETRICIIAWYLNSNILYCANLWIASACTDCRWVYIFGLRTGWLRSVKRKKSSSIFTWYITKSNSTFSGKDRWTQMYINFKIFVDLRTIFQNYPSSEILNLRWVNKWQSTLDKMALLKSNVHLYWCPYFKRRRLIFKANVLGPLKL